MRTLLALLFVTLLVTASIASELETKKEKKEYKRSLKFVRNPNRVAFMSKQDASGSKAFLKFALIQNSGIDLRVAFILSGEGDDESDRKNSNNKSTYNDDDLTGVLQDFKLKFLELIEHEGDEYKAGTTTALSTLDLGTNYWKNFETPTTETLNGTTVYKAVAEGSDGVVTLSFYVTPDLVLNGGSVFDPLAVKFSMEVTGYSYKSTTSRLTLKMAIFSKDKAEVGSKTEFEKQGIANGTHPMKQVNFGSNLGYAAFEEKASVGGAEANVVLSAPTKEGTSDSAGRGRYIAYLTFQGHGNIVYDPATGISEDGVADYSPAAAVVPVFFLLFAVLALLFF
eukprot:GCRY01000884.1.p1 GENE.GCRY01000884.1~~GCRY01000884.1.p1  ORF type:complete len:339 (-),score=105.90 GCRY01000884.1:268-1284(-)